MQHSAKRRLSLVFSLFAVLVLLVGCVAPTAPAAEPAAEEAAAEAPAAEAAAEGDTLQIGFSIPGMSFPFFVHMEKQFRAAAEELGGIEVITFDGQDDTAKQAADVESVITQGLDGLVISPRTTEGLAEFIQQAVDAGIPVVTVDRRAEGVTGVLAHVGADNVLGGEQQGNTILELFPDGAKLIELLGTPGASPAIDRSLGLHNVIDGVANIEVVCQQTGNFNRDDGLSVTENCLTANADAAAIVAANDDMALGAVEAVKAAGLAIPILGYDALPEALQSIDAGDLHGTVEQFPGEQSATALRTIVDFIRDGTTPESDTIFIAPKMITADNFAEAERLEEAGVQ